MEEKKKCKYCQSEIDKKAKICPNCKKKQKHTIRNVILGIIVFIIISALLSSGGDKKISPKYDSNNNPVFVEEDKIPYIYSDTSSYYGMFVELKGQVFSEPQIDSEKTFLQMFADPDKSEKNTLVYYTDSIDLKTDDYVKVVGYITGVTSYSNPFGGNVSAPTIVATKIEKISYKDAVSPTLKEVTYNNKIINQHGYIVEINKIEFAEKETRIYITAKNEANADLSLYSYSATVTQNGKQYETQSNFNADYEKIQSSLKPGITSSGVFVFPKLEQTNLNFIIDGSSSNYNIDINEYNFNLEI